jgi:hypothetical protein
MQSLHNYIEDLKLLVNKCVDFDYLFTNKMINFFCVKRENESVVMLVHRSFFYIKKKMWVVIFVEFIGVPLHR